MLRCVRPIRIKVFKKDGSREFFNVPCGKCYCCLKAKQQDWVNRMIHEQRSSRSCYFITITYDDLHVPHNDYGGLTLRKKDFQNFLKRLRRYYDRPLRFFGCGEYGSHTIRPHYHLCVFLEDYCDIEIFDLFVQKAWPFGFSSTSVISESRMAYTAKYCLKSFSYPEHSERPFIQMSRRPGIGADYLADTSIHDYHLEHPFLVIDGHKERLPRYYRDKIGIVSDGNYSILENDFYTSDSRWARVKEFSRKMDKYKTQNEVL